LPGAALAHDAFGDLGPFYQAFLHPLVDPAQGLLVAAAAVALAIQPVASLRVAFAALALGAASMLVGRTVVDVADPGLLEIAVLTVLAAAVAVLALRPGPAVSGLLAALLGAVAALSIDRAGSGLTAVLSVAGGTAGIAFGTLFLWGAIDLAARRISPLAPRVAGAWLAAIGVMVAALPA
jgi:hypothetical protein